MFAFQYRKAKTLKEAGELLARDGRVVVETAPPGASHAAERAHIEIAGDLGVSVLPFMMALSVAGAASFLTPVATPANTMVLEPGDYSLRLAAVDHDGVDIGRLCGFHEQVRRLGEHCEIDRARVDHDQVGGRQRRTQVDDRVFNHCHPIVGPWPRRGARPPPGPADPPR
mgnify:CR=1 FL=1